MLLADRPVKGQHSQTLFEDNEGPQKVSIIMDVPIKWFEFREYVRKGLIHGQSKLSVLNGCLLIEQGLTISRNHLSFMKQCIDPIK